MSLFMLKLAQYLILNNHIPFNSLPFRRAFREHRGRDRSVDIVWCVCSVFIVCSFLFSNDDAKIRQTFYLFQIFSQKTNKFAYINYFSYLCTQMSKEQ